MTVSMISCPSCRTLLFSDTIVCPACQHVLDAERAALLGENDDLAKSRSEQIPCRSCGEANQIGLVRCWNCSSFLREDIQEAYYAMLRSQRETTYSQPGHRGKQESERDDSYTESDSYGNEDDDFELTGHYSFSNPPPPESSETYPLNPPPSAPSNGSGPKPPASQPQQEAAEEDTERKRPPVEEDPDAEDHSVATGGDVLLDIALNEEKESEKVRKKREAVAQKKRKVSGEAPSAERAAAQKKALARRKAALKRAAEEKRKANLKFGVWLDDVHQHAINPQKLKLKPGSMEKQFELVDVGCSAGGVMVVSLAKKSGLFGKKAKPEEVREEVREYLETDKKKAELPAPKHQFHEAETVGQIKVVQPVVYVHESMFAGIPIFGEGRIAVRLPINPESPEQQFLSFWLTEFRRFAAALEKYYQLKDLGILEGVPLTDPVLDLKCHYSETPIQALDPEAVKFFQADPSIKLELVGRRCEGCGLAVSEEARRKEKIGGLNGKSIAKAKCPKCEKKFGSTSLFKIGEPEKKPAGAEKKSAQKK